MNSKLQDAVSIFKALGWEDATLENVLLLPLGTSNQKQISLAGLKSGDWGGYDQTGDGAYGWHSYIDVDEGKLALFAIRVGVDARRAANISRNAEHEILIAVIAARGAKYASDFIIFACISRRRLYEHSPTAYCNTAVQLVDRLSLDVPQNVEYMKDWSAYAASAMRLKSKVRYGEYFMPRLDLTEKHFTDHIKTGVAVNTPATGPFGRVLPAGVLRGWISREQGIALTFSALDASVRPGDRKVWLGVLDDLNISDVELCQRTQALIPMLASGDSAVISRLAPVLIANADDSRDLYNRDCMYKKLYANNL